MFSPHRRPGLSPLVRSAVVLSALALTAVGLSSAAAAAPTRPAAIPEAAAPEAVSYDAAVLADTPSGYWTLGHPGAATEPDLSHYRLSGRYYHSPAATRLPNGAIATVFNGTNQYFQVPDAAQLSSATRGILTLEAWMRPDTLVFPKAEGNKYVHWMGKGEPNQQEYVARMYSADNTVNRGNRISGYQFNRSGSLGAGSYFQDTVRTGQWIHYVLVINSKAKSPQYPHGYTKLYKNGVLRDQDDLSLSGVVMVPQRGNAPFRVGTRDFGSFFKGAVGKVAVYDKELSASRIARHYQVMTAKP